MDIAVTKLKLIDWLMHLSDEAQLEKLLIVKAEMDEGIVAYNSLGEPMNINQYKTKLDRGMKDIEEGRYMSEDDLANDMKLW